MPQIFSPDGVLMSGDAASSPSAVPSSGQIAQIAQLDKRNKILLQHSQKTEAAAKMFADKLDAIARARQAFENDAPPAFDKAQGRYVELFVAFLDAVDAALEKKFFPEIPFAT